jgi:hypothetical protein
MRIVLTAARLKEVVHYDPTSGRFTMLVVARRKRIGDEAGFRNPGGYLRITVDGQQYYSNRLAWLYMTGSWPPGRLEVDHRDTDPANDKWENLRLATRGQNVINRRRFSSRKLLKGTHRVGNRFTAFVQADRKREYLGCFETEEKAHAAYCARARELHGEFANFGSK